MAERVVKVEVADVSEDDNFYWPRIVKVVLTRETATVLEGACRARGTDTDAKKYAEVIQDTLEQLATQRGQ